MSINYQYNKPQIFLSEKQNFKSFSFENFENHYFTCLKFLKDGKLAIGSTDSSLSIFTSKNFEIFLIINNTDLNNNSPYPTFITQLSDGRLIYSLSDFNIKIIKINNNKTYRVEQLLLSHTDKIFKIIELMDERIVSTSLDLTIKIWEKNYKNHLFEEDFDLEGEGAENIIEVKNNILVASNSKESILKFYDLEKKRVINTIKQINCSNNNNNLGLFKNNLLFVVGEKITVINIDTYRIVYEITNKVNNTYFNSIRLLNENSYLISNDKNVFQYGFDKKLKYNNEDVDYEKIEDIDVDIFETVATISSKNIKLWK